MIEKYIPKLIEEQNEVILPTFGAFIAAFSGAEISGKNILPPHLKVSFNPKITTDKLHMLKKTVILNERVSESDYEDFYHAFLEQINESVSEKGFYKFRGLGALHKNYSGDWEFEVDKNISLLPESYGLPTLQKTAIKPVATVSVEPDVKQEIEPATEEAHAGTGQRAENEEKETQESLKSSPLMWLLLIPVVLVGGLLFYLFTDKSPEKITLSEETKTEITVTQPETGSQANTAQETQNTTGGTQVAPESNPQPVKVANEKFYIIVASVATEAKAKQFVARLKSQGFNSPEYMLNDANGQYRIAAAATDDKTSATDKQNAVKKFYKDAWILKK